MRSMRTTTSLAPLVALGLLCGSACGPPSPPPGPGDLQQIPQALTYTAGDAGIGFVYDAVGRLVGVITPTATAAKYVYDKAGNITKIVSISATTLSVLGFASSQVSPGTSLTIYGTAFSTTLANNTVKINGVTVTVTSATATTLVVTVPAGVTAGTVSVTVGGTTITSTDPVVVTPGAPTITSFAPDAGLVDAGLSITGTGFDTMLTNNQVWLNRTALVVLSATATTITALVPDEVVSGALTVGTTNGVAVSAHDFIVPPPGYTVTQIGTTGRTTIGGTALVVSADAGTAGLALFDAQQGATLGIHLTNMSGAWGATLVVFDPQGATILSQAISSAYTILHYNIPPVLLNGTYEAAIEAPSLANGYFRTSVQVSASTAIGLWDAGTFTGTTAGQEGLYTFYAVAGTNYSLMLSASTFPNNIYAGVYDPIGTLVGSAYAQVGTNGVADLVGLTLTGQYTVVLTPSISDTGHVAVTLLQDDTGTLATDGTVKAISLVSGQRGDYSFATTAGTFLGLGVPSLSTTPGGTYVTFSVTDPNTTSVGQLQLNAPSNIPLLTPLDGGTYIVRVEPYQSASVSVSLDLIAPVSAALASGTPATLLTTKVGQYGRYTFSASAGDSLSLLVSGSTFTNPITVSVYSPSNTLVGYTTEYNGNDSVVDMVHLAATGTYSVVIDPYNVDTGQTAVTLWADDTAVLATDGGVKSISLGKGQRGDYTFTGTAGTFLGLGVPAMTMTPTGHYVYLTLTDPNSTVLLNQYFTVPGSADLLQPLDGGTYTIRVEPYPYAEVSPSHAIAATMNLELIQPASATLVRGTGTTFTPSEIGQFARYVFTATAGDNLSLLLSGSTFPSYVGVSVNDPNGNSVSGGTVATGVSSVIDLNGVQGQSAQLGLPLSGTYVVFVTPNGADTGHLTLTLLTDDSGPIATDGGIRSISLVAGQRGDYTFGGTIGEWLGIGMPSLATTPASQSVSLILNDPLGLTVFYSSAFTSPASGDPPQLADGGTYTIRVEPTGAPAVTMGLDLAQPLTGTLTLAGAATTFTTAIAGQDGRYTWADTSGSNRTITLSANTFASGVLIKVNAPDGTQLLSASYSDGGTASLTSLPATGTYVLIVDPLLASTGQEKMQVQ